MLAAEDDVNGRRIKRGVVLTAIVAAGAIAAPGAQAFDSGPHFDINRDAFGAEGFGRDAVRTAQVSNWFVDLYENAGSTPQSGHASWWKALLTKSFWKGEVEHWSPTVLDAVRRSHFDSVGGGWGYHRPGSYENEFNRLLRATVKICREARPDPLQCLIAVGASTHQVHDFYAHSNWAETRFREIPGIDGPGWEARGYGTAPAWFDIPVQVRTNPAERVYSNGDSSEKVSLSDPLFGRKHGGWKTDNNVNLATSMNKDWPGRPRYREAYMAAYFATRQWIAAVRDSLADEPFWARVRSYAPPTATLRRQLTKDLRQGAFSMSFWAGHWYGEGSTRFSGDAGPGGSLDDLFNAADDYFAGRTSTYRRRFEQVIVGLRDLAAQTPVAPVKSTHDMQLDTQFVSLKTTYLKGLGAGDIGPDEADFYVQGSIAGQPFTSAFLHGYDSFSFRQPSRPFTFLKAVSRGATMPEPLRYLRVEIRTANVSGAGTDGDVYLRVNAGKRFALDKLVYDDFERGDVDSYSLPVDRAAPLDGAPGGYDASALRELQIEKSGGGDWKLAGVRVFMNDRLLYRSDHIDRWFRGGFSAFRPSGYIPPGTQGVASVPVWISLYDADSFLYGGDDHADINSDHRRRNEGISFDRGAPIERTVQGGDRWAGRIFTDGDRARLRYLLEIVPLMPSPRPTSTPPGQPPPPPPPPGPKADLVIDELDGVHFVVKNRGAGPAGPFVVTVSATPTFSFTGLAAGASETREFMCRNDVTAVADANDEVAESDETNNSRLAPGTHCVT